MSELKLKDCCISISDGDHLPPPKVNNGIPFITISNIDSSNHIDFKNTLFVPEEYYENLDNIRKPIINDILYSVVGSFGKAVLVKENKKFVFQRHIAILRPNPDIVNPSYLYYIMSSKSFYNKADVVAIGAAQRTISLTSLRNLKINLPTIDIQNRIAEILSRYDTLIENYQKQIKLLEESAQRLYKEWFVDFRFPGHENTKIVDGMPEGWEKKCVDDIYQIKYGKNLSTKLVTVKGNYPVYGANGIIGYYSKSNCHEQVVLITSRGNGSGDVSMTFHKESFITNNSFIVTPLEKYSYCKLAFTYHFLKHANFYSVRTGAAQPQLTNQSIHTVDVLLPMQQLIEAYCKLISPSIELIMELKGSMLYIVEARDRLLPKLMGGEIEV